MSEIKQLNVNGTTYTLKDETARNDIETLEASIEDLSASGTITGTWTPTVYDGSYNALSYSFSVCTGTYVQIGRFVVFDCSIMYTSSTFIVGGISLPVTPEVNSAIIYAPGIVFASSSSNYYQCSQLVPGTPILRNYDTKTASNTWRIRGWYLAAE